ncbi:MAG: hypothetical protein JXR41_03910 [Bacteroidales bacterium]|nr:hypothetical protein [Bacteroidales bacterium]MBN2762213.1 hypothetical protein [Bacteroidales bacterium]
MKRSLYEMAPGLFLSAALRNFPAAILIMLLMSMVLSCPVYAQKTKPGSFIIYMNAPHLAKLSEDKSTETSTAQNIWAAELGMELRLFRYTGISFGVSFGSIKDYNTFDQLTTHGEMESSFNTYSLNAKAGLWSPPIIPFEKRDLQIVFRVNGGYEHMTGKREIDECVDCREDKYDIKAGFFAEPEVNFFFFQNLLGIGTAYRYYFSETDLKYNMVILRLMLRIDF